MNEMDAYRLPAVFAISVLIIWTSLITFIESASIVLERTGGGKKRLYTLAESQSLAED